METRTYTVYSFEELSDAGKEKALQNYADINVDHDWWDHIYMDAENIGLKLASFDLDRNRHATGQLTVNMVDVIHAILKEHGSSCDTHKLAVSYLARYQKESAQWYKLARVEDPDYYNEQVYFDETDAYTDMRDDFTRDLLEEYSIILQHDYEYLTSEEAIEETLLANDYEFTENGRID